MSQSDLFVDIGNSAVKWCSHDSEIFIQGVDLFSSKLLPKAESVWVSAVAHLNIVEEIKTKFTSVNLVKPSKQHGKLTLSYDDPSKFGVDRFLAMLGALERFPEKPLLVIDAGSAVTFDVIDSQGMHQGGLKITLKTHGKVELMQCLFQLLIHKFKILNYNIQMVL